jgi:hypothetical protein
MKSHSHVGGVIAAATLALAVTGVAPEAFGQRVRGTTRTAVNRNVAVQQNVHVHRDVHVDVDHDYHPVARAAGTAAAVAVTAAAIGSVVYALPPACTTVMVANVAYQQCGSTWYRPQYAGTQVSYVVVNPPH